jgi:hypothetical protein
MMPDSTASSPVMKRHPAGQSETDQRLQEQASEAERRQRALVKLREALQRGRLPYDRQLYATDFGFDAELATVRRNIIDALDNLKVNHS